MEEHTRKVLHRLQEHGVKLKLRKVLTVQKEVVFLGRVVSEEGYKLDPSSIKPVLSLKESSPKTVNEVHKLMGFLNYYCWYKKNFSKIAKPIYDLINITDHPSEESTREKPKPRQGKRNPSQLPPRHPVVWTSSHQSALDKLIDCLTCAPVMAYPNFEKPFVLHTDASKDGLGAVLYQHQLKMISFALLLMGHALWLLPRRTSTYILESWSSLH